MVDQSLLNVGKTFDKMIHDILMDKKNGGLNNNIIRCTCNLPYVCTLIVLISKSHQIIEGFV